MIAKGQKIGDYFLVERIGRGGFGDVWLAEKRTALSVSQFALKFFRPVEIDESAIKTIQKEVEVWQKISGLPNNISVIEADRIDDYIYIVSEYADGGSLQNWLAANGGKAHSIDEAVRIVLEILNGLEYLHRAGFIHRDIKPANILIRKGTFCLADFGVTREIKTHSITAHTAGTYNYMPPEAFGKSPQVSPATDIWATAVIFQELLTGALPFPQTEVPALMYSILYEEPDAMPEAIPSELREIVRRALRKDRAARYASPQEMIDALRNFSSGAPEIVQSNGEKSKEIIAPKTLEKESEILAAPIAAETIVDESFAHPNDIQKNANLSSNTPKKNAPEKAVAANTPPRRLRRNNLVIVGLAAFLIIAAGLFFVAVSYLSTDADGYFDQGLECTKKQDYECAIEKYSNAIEKNPDYFEAYKHRAVVHYTTGDFQKAIADYDRAVELNSGDANVFYGRATALANSGEFERAIADYDKAIELDAQNPVNFFGRGLAFFNRKEYDRAIEDYTKAIELDANYAEAFNNRGNALDEQGKNERAVKDYTRAIELDPNFALAYSNRGTSYARQGNYKRAVEDLNRALEINPAITNAYFNRANVYYLQKDIEKALADYNRFIELNPNNALAFSNRAAIYANRKNYAQAIEDFTRAIELDPQDAQNYSNRATVYEKIGDQEKAKNDRQRYQSLTLKR